MKRMLLIAAVLCLPLLVLAQEQEEFSFSPDRPGVSTGPGVMHKGGIMWETGFDADKTDGAWTVVLPTTMFRFGVSDFAEVRLEYDGALAFSGNQAGYEVLPLVLGTKLHLSRGHGAVPEISFLANLSIPITKALCEEYAPAPSLYLLFENPVNDWFGVSYNVGGVWYGKSAVPDAFLALSLNFSPASKWGISVESYNYLGTDNDCFAYSCGVDAGLSYCILKNLQIDLNGGLNINKPGSIFTIGCGIAWQIR